MGAVERLYVDSDDSVRGLHTSAGQRCERRAEFAAPATERPRSSKNPSSCRTTAFCASSAEEARCTLPVAPQGGEDDLLKRLLLRTIAPEASSPCAIRDLRLSPALTASNVARRDGWWSPRSAPCTRRGRWPAAATPSS